MGSTLGEQVVSSQKGFGADLLEALTAAAELINTGRSRDGEGLRDVADVAAFGRRYGLGGRARAADVPALRAYRARLDAIVTACEAGDSPAAVRMINALLAETGAIPQIVAHDGRGPHIHVSRAAAPMADRITAHLAMGLAELLVSGESGGCAVARHRPAAMSSLTSPATGRDATATAAPAETGCTSPPTGPARPPPGNRPHRSPARQTETCAGSGAACTVAVMPVRTESRSTASVRRAPNAAMVRSAS